MAQGNDSPPRIDSHQHFWRYSVEEYGWIDDSMARLRRDFLPADLRGELDGIGLDGCIAVQARQSNAETDFLLELAEQNDWIQAVIGWVDLRSERVAAELERIAGHPKLAGVRHIVQAEPDEQFVLREDFQRGIAALRLHDLVYEVLVFPNQLPASTELCRRFPEQTFVLDHLAKPYARRGELQPWASHIREMAALPNVTCKLSGLVTEAEWSKWTVESLTPYVEVVFEAFGVDRILYGSDWPVCLVASEYRRWFETVGHWLEPLRPTERDAVLGGNAARIYGLSASR